MKKSFLKLWLALIVLALAATSCEKEVIYVDRETGQLVENENSRNTTQSNLSRDIMQPSLTPASSPYWIKAGESRKIANATIANVSKTLARTVNLEFTFKDAGALAVDSISYGIDQAVGAPLTRVEVVENKFVINGIKVPANTYFNISIYYKIKNSIPATIVEGSQIVLSMSGFSTDEAKVTLPMSGTLPKDILLDKVSLVGNNPNPNPDENAKASVWLSEPVVAYSNPFKIIGNAVSNELTISINNLASIEKTLSSLVADFGAGSKAIKMLRYSLNGGDWVVVKEENSKIVLRDLKLKSGQNILKAYFSLKPQVGVADNTNLSFSFTSLNDGDGGGVPASGKFASAVNVGSVSTKAPTLFRNNIHAHLRDPLLAVAKGGSGTAMVNVIQFQLIGPAPAKLYSVKFQNPYTAFNVVSGNDFRFTKDWSMSLNNGGIVSFEVSSSTAGTFTATFPSINIVPDGNWQLISVFNCYENPGNVFNSGVYTPSRYGVKVASKYDVVFLNSDGQVIDLSELSVFQDGKALN